MDYIYEKAPQCFCFIRADSLFVVIGWSVIFNRRLAKAIHRDANAYTEMRN